MARALDSWRSSRNGQCFEPLKELEGVEGRQGGTGVAKLDGAGPHDEGSLGKVPSEDDVVEGHLWLIERSGTARRAQTTGIVPPSTMAPPRVVP